MHITIGITPYVQFGEKQMDIEKAVNQSECLLVGEYFCLFFSHFREGNKAALLYSFNCKRIRLNLLRFIID